jgi:hypothetical protein
MTLTDQVQDLKSDVQNISTQVAENRTHIKHMINKTDKMHEDIRDISKHLLGSAEKKAGFWQKHYVKLIGGLLGSGGVTGLVIYLITNNIL